LEYDRGGVCGEVDEAIYRDVGGGEELMSKKKSKKAISTKKQDISISEVMEIVIKRLLGQQLSKEDSETVGRYYVLQVPSKMYRYRPYRPDDNREIEAIINNNIWFSALSEFNDPFESYYTLDVKSLISLDTDIKNIMGSLSLIQQQTLIEEVLEDIDYDKLHREIVSNYTVACFSEKNDSLLMWGHYSSGHRGICIEYDTMDLAYNKGKVIIPVNYSNNIPRIKNKDNASIMRFILQLLRTKCTDWKYECEWRCIQDKGACGKAWEAKGALLDSSLPTAIYVGCKAADEFIDTLVKTCTDTLKIPLYKMMQSKREYKLIPERIV